MVRQLRNFVIRLSINYIVLSILLMVTGVGISRRQLFGVWIAALVFAVLSVTVRRLLLALSLSLIIMTGGLFILIIDAVVLVLTAALTGLRVGTFWRALVGVVVMSIANVWVEKAFRAIGWLRDDHADAQEQENVITARSPGWWRRLLLLAILLGGVVFSGAMAIQVFLAVGQLTRSMPTITATAAAAFALFVFGVSWLVAEGLALERQARFAILVTLVVALLVVPPVTVQLFAAGPGYRPLSHEPRPETAYWDLATGSRIAYSFYPAQGERKRNPLVFLHGGLGRAVLDTDVAFFRQFADVGLDVYLYDLVGTGLSGRLEDVRQYAIGRHVRDLEAIRETIRADRLILVTHAEGAEVAVRYMIAHQDRVERVVFYSPTTMWNDQDYFQDESRTAAEMPLPYALPGLRQLAALSLGLHSPRTAAAYISQEEMTAWADRVVDEGKMVCAGDRALAPAPQAPGYNPYVGVVGDVTDDLPPDPRRGLRQVFLPAILLRGECDFVDWGVVGQYWEAVPSIQVYYVAHAGSMLHLSQPDLVKALILAFVNEQPMPLEPLSERAIWTGPPTVGAQ